MAHQIPPGTEYWNVYLLSREIVENTLASQLRRDDLVYLKLLIEKFDEQCIWKCIDTQVASLSVIDVNVWTLALLTVYEI